MTIIFLRCIDMLAVISNEATENENLLKYNDRSDKRE